jgi:hypothetical protein
MNPMNRCKTPTNLLLTSRALRRRPRRPVLRRRPRTQEDIPRPQTQNESLLGGRNFPIGTLRGKFMVVDTPDVSSTATPTGWARRAHPQPAEHAGDARRASSASSTW